MSKAGKSTKELKIAFVIARAVKIPNLTVGLKFDIDKDRKPKIIVIEVKSKAFPIVVCVFFDDKR
mgnify:CR=1 FL=1